jgi:glucosamine-6-phosphate deaminase
VTPRIEVFAPSSWAAATGARLGRWLAERPGRRLCLPTGSTPAPCYAAFAAYGGRLDATHVFLLDEFLLPAGHPARCDEMLRRDLLDRLDHRPLRFDRLDVDAGSLDEECRRYEMAVADGGLDLTILGIGGNGHLGLNEPGSAMDSPTRIVELHPRTVAAAQAYGGAMAARRGATMGLAAILASREIWLLATGSHKAGILQRALRGEVGPEVPASFLQRHPHTVVLADEAAAGETGGRRFGRVVPT